MMDAFKAGLIAARTELEKAIRLPNVDGFVTWHVIDMLETLDDLIATETPDGRDASIDQEISKIDRS